ncbi:FAD-dependent oxidoreductase [Sphingobium lignivorans]|uniref:D-amino-acid dehydrogenase n=1 Tax=Sphingobium lignivorans TaxID=2735886 RepID=A0ABR6NF01_9SPHN|nr:D-amino-acid dehydrogenase [Sphingobium lignivorans]
MSKNVIVIGGGVVGLAAAAALVEAGHQVRVIAPLSDSQPASWGNAGHIAVEQVEPLASRAAIRSVPRRLFWRGGALSLPVASLATWLPFTLRLVRAAAPSRFEAGKTALRGLLAASLPAWRRLTQRMETPDLLREDGHFILWEKHESALRGEAAWSAVDTGEAHFRRASVDELAHLGNLILPKPADAIRFEGSAHIADLGLCLDALRRLVERSGGEMRDGRASALASGPSGGVLVTLETGECLEADHALLCAGARSSELMRPLGYHVPMIDERGYHVEAPVTAAQWPEHLPPIVFEDRQMIVTRFRDKLRAASFVELSRPGAPADPAKWQRLEDHIAALGLPIGKDATRWMGSRPTLPDYLPAIGRCSRHPAIFHAFGHQHLGLTLAAVTADIVADMIAGKAPPPALSLDRF